MDFMKKMTFSEMERTMTAASLVGEKLYGIIVFKENSFKRYYTQQERSYLVDSITSMHFNPNALSDSIVGDCLDGEDDGARLDRCMKEEGWVPEYCYLVERTCRYCEYLHSLAPDSEALVCNMGWIISPRVIDKKHCKDWKCKELKEYKPIKRSYYFAEVPEPGSFGKAKELKASNLTAAKREASRKSGFFGTVLVIGTELSEDGFIKPESVLTSKIDGEWEDYEC